MYHDTVQLLTELAKNPIVELITAVLVIEKMQDLGIIGGWQSLVGEGAITSIITAQQIAPLLPSLIQAGGQTIGSLMKLAPALAAGA